MVLPDYGAAMFPTELNLDVAETNSMDESADELVEVTALEHFSAILQQAQQLATLAQKKQCTTQKWPAHYSGRSKRTEYRQKKARNDLALKGFLPLQEYMASKQPESELSPGLGEPHQVHSEAVASREEEGITKALHTQDKATLESDTFPEEKGAQAEDQQSATHMPQTLPSIQPVAEEEEESSVEGDV